MFPKAKRLRGAQLELAMDASETSGEPLPKGEQPSALAHLLLSLWSHGHLSASLIQQLAHMAGASHPELVSMASCGNWGELAGNRDVMATFCADIQITPPPSRWKCWTPKLAFILWKMPASFYLTCSSLTLPTITLNNLKLCLAWASWMTFGWKWRKVRMAGSWAIQSALTKGKALSKGQCSRKSLQSHFSSMQME